MSRFRKTCSTCSMRSAWKTKLWVLSQFEARNGAALQELITKHNVELIQFPEEVLECPA